MHIPELDIFPPHTCCDDASRYLFPPCRGTNGKHVLFEVWSLPICAQPIEYWFFDLGDGGPLIEVAFCPFCGERLPETEASAEGEDNAP